MAGLDLSFLKTPASKRFLAKAKQEGNKKRAARAAEYRARKRSDLECPAFMPDINAVYGDGFKSPIDGRWISSRSQLRAHNRTHRVDQCGDVKIEDYTAYVEKQRDVGDINTKEVSFEWSPYQK